MNSPSTIDDIYIQLPRFIDESVQRIEDKYLPAVIREFERNGTRFKFIISPALIHDQNTGDRHYYPTKREEMVELGLRRLAVNTNPNFKESEHTLYFAFDQLLNELTDISGDPSYGDGEIRLALNILSDVTYELISDTSELSFRLIEQLKMREKDEQIYYFAQFSALFLSQNNGFDFCFEGTNRNKTTQRK
jgi:hypothetical protein